MSAFSGNIINRVSHASRLFKPSQVTASLANEQLGSQPDVDACKSYDLLRDHGLIRRINHASFALLPAFYRSLDKLSCIVDREMVGIGAQRMVLPTLVNQNLWKKSGRISQANVKLRDFYKVTDRRQSHHFLAPTHEEPITQLIADARLNENKLPLLLYQISSKFRDEPRPRYGLFRTNEFVMKDLYSFDASLDNAKETYEAVGQAYERIFNNLGLKFIKAASDVGVIGGLYSHEYHLECPMGEDKLLMCHSCHTSTNIELQSLANGEKECQNDTCPNCRSTQVENVKGIEVGHTFLLSDKYSKPLEANYLTKGNSNRPLEMGCYGLGLTRILAAGVEILSCESTMVESKSNKLVRQIRWPKHTEPFNMTIITPKEGSKEDKAGAVQFCSSLAQTVSQKFDMDVLLDDRISMTIGRRLFDVQSLGSPLVVIVGARYLRDVPNVELLALKDDGHYEQVCLTHQDLFDMLEGLSKK